MLSRPVRAEREHHLLILIIGDKVPSFQFATATAVSAIGYQGHRILRTHQLRSVIKETNH